jgi:hypothetical protein
MNAPSRLILPAAIGAPFGGGICLGGMFVDQTPYVIIAGPKQLAQLKPQAWGSSKMVKGAMSVYDGLANTNAMAAAGSPAAKEVRALRIGDFDDWYIGARGDHLLAVAANDQLPEGEAFDTDDWYWTSTQDADAGSAWLQLFNDGSQIWVRKLTHDLVRGFRRQVI